MPAPPQTSHLFLDDRLIAQRDNVELTIAPCRMHDANPLRLDGDARWTNDHLMLSFYLDSGSGEYRGWANRNVPVEGRPEASVYRPVRSADGIEWRTAGDPIMLPLRDRYHPGYPLVEMVVFLDEREMDPDRRFKAIYQGAAILDERGRVAIAQDRPEFGPAVARGTEPAKGYFAACSPDGVHWPEHHPIVVGPALGYKIGSDQWCGGDGFPGVLYSPRLGKYVTFIRTNIDPGPGRRRERAVGRFESENFIHWSPHQLVLRSNVDRHVALGRSKHDYYYFQAWPCGDGYLGIIDVFYWDEDRTHLELAWSPDTIHWKHICPGTDLVPQKALGEFGGGCNTAAYRPINVGDEVHVYYGGSDAKHGAPVRNSSLLLALFQRDRLAGLGPKGLAGGRIVTRPMEHDDGRIRLNCNAAGGEVRVALLDSDGRPIDGFGLADCCPLTRDQIAHDVAWKAGSTAPATPDGRVCLEIELSRAMLYSIEVS